MKIKELIHVSGLPGLYKIGATRSNGLIIEDIDTGKSKFASMRKHQFTPLSSVAIYTETDATELIKIFDSIAELENQIPIPELNSATHLLFEYFGSILPDYDKERVMISDVKKILKWYIFLKKRELYPFEEDVGSDIEDDSEE